MTDRFPYVDAGDEITLDLVNGANLHGTLAGYSLDDGGDLRSLSLQEPGQEYPLHVRGELIAVWRCGKPIRRAPAAGIAVPAGVPPNLAGRNHR